MVDLSILMALMRGLHLAAALSLLGAAAFSAWVLPTTPTVPEALRRDLSRLRWISGMLALVAGTAWFTLQAAAIADAKTLADMFRVLPLVAEHSRFGKMVVLRLGLLTGATLVGQRRGGLSPAIALTAISLALEGLIGHAGAAPGSLGIQLLVSEALHLNAAGIWLGALLPLCLSLRVLPEAEAAATCLRFSPFGLACVMILAGTGFVQAWALVGGIPALFGTAYGQIALLKIGLFLLALVLAVINRVWLTDRLAAVSTKAPGNDSNAARGELMASALAEALIGLAIVIAAAFLASTVPGVHQQPVWPFSWQFSLVTVQEDADFRQEVVLSVLLVGLASVLMLASLLWQRFRITLLVILLVTLAWRGPSFFLLIVEAYPTSFQISPTGFSVESIAHGQALFAQNCVGCHGPDGEGNGPSAALLRIKPADLTQPHIWGHSDGEMFWWLTHGIDDPEGGLAMPGFAGVLSSDDRWALIDYVRAHSAEAFKRGPTFDPPVPAPAAPIKCNGLAASRTSDLRGRAVLVALGVPKPGQFAIPPEEAVTLIVPADGSAPVNPLPGVCVVASPAAWNAYAVLADLPWDEAAGATFLVDPNGWLRTVRLPDAANGWRSSDDLLAAIRDIRAHPIEQRSGASYEHHH